MLETINNVYISQMMKLKILGLILIGFLFSGFENNKVTKRTLASVEGLSLYMDHDIFGGSYRKLRFEFYGTKQFENKFKLVFDYEIIDDKIIIRLIDKINVEKNQKNIVNYSFEKLKTPIGRLSFADELLPQRTYSLILKTLNFEIKSELIVENDKIVLNIPDNNYVTCSNNVVYPIPKDLLFGSVCFYGNADNKCIAKFFKEMEDLGLKKASVPNYPYMHLTVDDTGRPIDEHWPNNQHCLKFLYKMDDNFRKVTRLAKRWFRKNYQINFSMFSSNGDQAILTEGKGIATTYAK